MEYEIKVRSKRHKEVDDDALALAVVILATILAEDEHDENARSAPSAPVRIPRLTTPRAAEEVVDADRPLIQAYYEDVEQLKAQGASNAEAVRAVAERFGKTPNAVRAGSYQWAKRLLRERVA